jgi:hypothetical protein
VGQRRLGRGLGRLLAARVELTRGAEIADLYFANLRRSIPRTGRLYRGQGADWKSAYASSIIYSKGAWVLHTLRTYLDDDDLWWAALRDFNLSFRYGNATTEDFRGVLERVTGRSWERFFAQWVYGDGYPTLRGSVRARERTLAVEIDNPTGVGAFHVPLDLEWQEAGRTVRERLLLEPGHNRIDLERESAPTGLRLVSLHRILGEHDVEVGSR